MTIQLLGEITHIARYPVKSFAGESLAGGKLERYGLYGDRSHSFIDETKEGWDSYFTARDIPDMLRYRAELAGEDSENEFPEVRVTAPDGRTFSWNEELLREIQTYSGRKMSMKRHTPDSTDLLAVDEGSLLIVTDVSLRRLEAFWGKPLDPRRFRANIVVAADDESCHESRWIGKRLSIGEAELHIDVPCERCSMIAIDPDTLERDTSLLKKVHEVMDLQFGVYASVRKPGLIHVGDKVYEEG
ncbi:MOSC domain-containing protein [Paenibacillus hamazuiensis]|uniref:MOSC domain-containing protein n=1 Tax=Paenibacillus hamazuiensis TaxID=2936508 RepID=UPI002010AB4C|nr:MOSC domain-containing protein [Paenibacillus hamazuiensis]